MENRKAEQQEKLRKGRSTEAEKGRGEERRHRGEEQHMRQREKL